MGRPPTPSEFLATTTYYPQVYSACDRKRHLQRRHSIQDVQVLYRCVVKPKSKRCIKNTHQWMLGLPYALK